MAMTKPGIKKPKVDVRHQTLLLKQKSAQVDRLLHMIEKASEILKKGTETDECADACMQAYKLLTYSS